MQSFVMVGVLCVDEVLDIDTFPAEDSKVRASKRRLLRGGSASNAAVVLRKLLSANAVAYAQVYLMSTIGDDSEGKFLKESCERSDVLVEGISQILGKSTPKSIVLRLHQTRTIIHHRDLDELSYDDFVKNLPSNAVTSRNCWFHFEGRNTSETLKMMQSLPKHAKLSLELERTRSRDEYKLLEASPTMVVFSHGFMEAFGFFSVTSFVIGFLLLNGYGPRTGNESVWVFTFGERGCIGVRVNRYSIIELFECSASAVTKVVDTLGAGDSFLAGLVFAMASLDFERLDTLLEFASDVAAAKVQVVGFDDINVESIVSLYNS